MAWDAAHEGDFALRVGAVSAGGPLVRRSPVGLIEPPPGPRRTAILAPELAPRKDLACVRHVAAHLDDELVRAVVAPLAAQPAGELDAQALTVEVHVAVEEVHLEEAQPATEGRLGAERDDGLGAVRRATGWPPLPTLACAA